MSSQATSDFRRRRKQNLVQVCGASCNICGYNRSISALEFHHIDPSVKEYSISKTGTCHDIEKDLVEVKKCLLVCANCHREIHDGLYDNVNLYTFQNYSETLAVQLIADRNKKFFKEPKFCRECGQPISGDGITGLCIQCAAKSRRIIERPSREELKNLIQHFPFTEIGRKFNVSDNTIRKWCKKENLPFRRKDLDQIKDWNEI